MSTETVLVSEVIPTTRERLYAAWLDSDEHSAFTAEEAAVEPFVGGSHSALSGKATGQVLALEPNRRIVQSWRADDFPDEAADSRLEVTFEETTGGTMVTLLHTGIPSGQSDRYRESWLESYLERMKKYFAGPSASSDGVTDQSTSSASDDFDDEPTNASGKPPRSEEATTAASPPRNRRPPARGAKSARPPAQAARSARPPAQAARSTRPPAQAARSARPPSKAKAPAKPAGKTKPARAGKAAARRPAKGVTAAAKRGSRPASGGKRPGKKMAKAAAKATSKSSKPTRGGKPRARPRGRR
jgi:uncharacterized protein YndB with AHSA1/START domain